MLKSIRQHSRKWFYATAATAGLVAGLAFNANTPASATDTRVTYSYVVTDSESTAVDLDIRYEDNLDYEYDHLGYDPDAPTLSAHCERLALAADHPTVTFTHYTWVECYDVPAAEAPEWVKATSNTGPGSPVERRYVAS